MLPKIDVLCQNVWLSRQLSVPDCFYRLKVSLSLSEGKFVATSTTESENVWPPRVWYATLQEDVAQIVLDRERKRQWPNHLMGLRFHRMLAA